MRRLLLLLAACDSSSPGTAVDGGATACALVADTVPTGRETPSGCAIVDRDTSACDAEREAAGITGFYRHFSCRVTLTKSATEIVASSDGLPDFASNYFPASDACHEAYAEGIQNPNTIKAQSYTVHFPLTPSGSAHPMTGAVVGLVVDGVAIYGDFAAPGDDIFEEVRTFDRCGGHPSPFSAYHDHAEPLSVTYDDARFVGVLRDGSPVYGRRDADDSYPTLDVAGGHTATTPDSPSTPVYHYHVSSQTSGSETQWFITKGMYNASPGSCTGC